MQNCSLRNDDVSVKIWLLAVQLMNSADTYATSKHLEKKPLIAVAREAVQTAEDARRVAQPFADLDFFPIPEQRGPILAYFARVGVGALDTMPLFPLSWQTSRSIVLTVRIPTLAQSARIGHPFS